MVDLQHVSSHFSNAWMLITCNDGVWIANYYLYNDHSQKELHQLAECTQTGQELDNHVQLQHNGDTCQQFLHMLSQQAEPAYQ